VISASTTPLLNQVDLLVADLDASVVTAFSACRRKTRTP
jgi:hypothetical protein